MATAAWLCTYAIDQNAAMLVEVSDFLQNEWGGAVRPDWVRNRITFPRPIATEQGATEFDSSEGRARGSWRNQTALAADQGTQYEQSR
jgi:hypothetical protein